MQASPVWLDWPLFLHKYAPMLENISIVLVEPSGDENVGMVARAMKNCAIRDLRLVNPAPFRTKAANKWACHALDILGSAREFSNLKKALSDSSLVVGLSRREGKLRPPTATFRKTIDKIYSRAKKSRVSLVFGREDDGLKRSELAQCDMVLSIPASDNHPSFNLAQAVMIMCHEMFKKQETKKQRGKEGKNEFRRGFVSRKELTPVINAMRKTLVNLGYDNKDGGKLRGKIMKRFSELFGRGGLRREDIGMFLGLIARIGNRAK